MWCRVLLPVVAITCTFQSEITADTDDLLCVLIMSGLQKEDLDLNLLKKLQRHNVNIEDLENRKTIDRCYRRRSNLDDDMRKNSSLPTTETVETITNQNEPTYLPTIEFKPDENPKNKEISNNSLIDKTVSEGRITSSSKPTLNYENFIKMWTTFNRRSYDGDKDSNKTEKSDIAQLPKTRAEEIETISQETDLAAFQRMIKSYISLSQSVSSTTEKNIDIVSLEIMKFLKNNIRKNKTVDTQNRKRNQTELTKKLQANDNFDERLSVIETVKEKENTNVSTTTMENKHGSQNLSLEKFIDFWIAFNKTNHLPNDVVVAAKDTKKDVTIHMPVNLNMNANTSNLDNIRIMFDYITAQQKATSTERTTTPRQTDIVSQLIIKFLRNNNVKDDTTLHFLNITEPTTLKYDITSSMHGNEIVMFKSTTTPVLEKPEKQESFLQITKENVSYEPTPNSKANLDPKLMYMKMLKAYIDKKYVETSTQLPTTTPRHNDIILQEIKELFETNGTYNRIIQMRTIPPIKKRNLILKKSLNTGNTYKISNIKKRPVYNPQNAERINIQSTLTPSILSQDLHQIFILFESYLSSTNVRITTSEPTLAPIDVIAQKVKEYLDNDKRNRKIISVTEEAPQENKSTSLSDFRNQLMLRQAKQLEMFRQFTTTPKKRIEYYRTTTKKSTTAKKSTTTKKRISTKQPPPNVNKGKKNETIETKLSGDIIKEITDKVRASVLKDLQMHLPSTELTTTSKTPKVVVHQETRMTDTKTPSNTSQIEDGVKTDTKYTLDNIVNLLKQLENIEKTSLSADLKHNSKMVRTKNEFHGPINVVYPSLPMKYMFPINNTERITHMPIFVQPFQDPQINNPELSIRNTNSNEYKYGTPVKNMHQDVKPPRIIQTDDLQVPLLGIPVSRAVSPINQNIIVTTMSPIELFRDEYRHRLNARKPSHQGLFRDYDKYKANLDRQSDFEYGRPLDTYDNDRLSNIEYDKRASDTETDRYNSDAKISRLDSDSDLSYAYRGHGHGYLPHNRYSKLRHKKIVDHIRPPSRDRQPLHTYSNFDQEYLTNVRPKSSQILDLSLENKKERFHEKLEKSISDERKNQYKGKKSPTKGKRTYVHSRQQMPISEMTEKKKQQKESHFLNFIKRQKEVNDMLEGILATVAKSKSNDRIRSVETPDTIH